MCADHKRECRPRRAGRHGADNGQAYGLSEFIVKQDSDVKVAYTVELDEMIQKLEDNTWNPEAEN